MDDLISRQAAIDAFLTELTKWERKNLLHTWSTVEVKYFVVDMLEKSPSAEPEIVRCKECKHQEKFFHTDRRRKDGGYYIYGCELAEGYSHVCLDDDFCSRAERRTNG